MGKINQPTNLLDEIRDLKRQLAEVRKRVGLGNAQISSGDLTVKGGTIRVHDENDKQIVQIGAHLDGSGNPVTGLVVRRPDETVSLWAYGDEGGNGYFSVWDEAGHIVMSTDGVSGQGLATPYIPGEVIPTRYLTTFAGESTTSTSYGPAGVWTIQGLKQHPRILVDVQVSATDATTPAEIRLRNANTGAIISGPVSVPANTNSNYTLIGNLTGGHLEYYKVEVDVRKVSGAGTVWSNVNYTYGLQS